MGIVQDQEEMITMVMIKFKMTMVLNDDDAKNRDHDIRNYNQIRNSFLDLQIFLLVQISFHTSNIFVDIDLSIYLGLCCLRTILAELCLYLISQHPGAIRSLAYIQRPGMCALHCGIAGYIYRMLDILVFTFV